MDALERNILVTAIAARVNENTAASLERAAEWAIGVRDRAKYWLRFFSFAVFLVGLCAYAKLSLYYVVPPFVATCLLFEWWMRKKAQGEWRRYETARQHFRALLECRKTLESMTKEERMEVNPEIAKWFLNPFVPGGLEHTPLWEDVEDGVLFPASRRMKLESMGLADRRDESPTYKTAEYAYAKYCEIDPGRIWIAKLRERGGYVAPWEKLTEPLNRHKAQYGTKENA